MIFKDEINRLFWYTFSDEVRKRRIKLAPDDREDAFGLLVRVINSVALIKDFMAELKRDAYYNISTMEYNAERDGKLVFLDDARKRRAEGLKLCRY